MLCVPPGRSADEVSALGLPRRFPSVMRRDSTDLLRPTVRPLVDDVHNVEKRRSFLLCLKRFAMECTGHEQLTRSGGDASLAGEVSMSTRHLVALAAIL